jgi:hypothetical protein
MTVPSLDTTWITATLECRDELTGDEEAVVSTTVTYYTTMNPIVMRDFCDADPWESEPNEWCAIADGPLCLGRPVFGYPDDEWDWFQVNAPPGGLVVELTSGSGIGSEEGIQLGLCDQTCNTQTTPYWDNNPSDGYRIEAPGISGEYYVVIFKDPATGFSTDWTYTLLVDSW